MFDIEKFINSKPKLYLFTFILGIILYIFDMTLLSVIGLILPNIAEWLDEGLMIFILFAISISAWRFFELKKFGIIGIILIFIIGFKFLPITGVTLTKHTYLATVTVAGIDEYNKGRNTMFKATLLKKGESESSDYRVQDAIIFPPYWWQYSSNTRTKLKEAASTKKEVCITSYGVRNGLFSVFPNVVEVKKAESCE